MTPGHVFVVHGRVEAVVHDAAVVPVGESLEFTDHWRPLLGERDPAPSGDWPGRGWAATDRDDLWLIDVGPGEHVAVDELAGRVGEVVGEIARSGLTPPAGRVKPLVALPFVGLEGGGLGDRRGDVVRSQLEAAGIVAHDHGIDVAMVTPESSVYAAAQHVRRRLLEDAGEVDARAAALARRARAGELALFLGAGVSVPAGLPSWGALLQRLAEEAELGDAEELRLLSPLDQAELLQAADPEFQRRVAESIERHRTPSLSHALLAGLGCGEVATTNYDALFEAAVAAPGGEPPTVLPWQSAVGARRWLLKLHGDVDRPQSIVLTRADFVRYDAFRRPSGSLLQALLLTRHLLFVGASLRDDNVIRLAREVQEFRREHDLGDGPFGTVLDVDHDLVRARLWQGQLDWIHLEGDGVEARARELELFLDRVAMHASADSGWLLDPRFAGLLSEADAALAEEARALVARLRDAGGPAWQALLGALSEFGA